MAITAAQVKELREMSGAGMMDCKKALTNTDGDLDAAMEYLRENGLAKAAKKAGRIAAEGIVATNVSGDGKVASIVEVNSETEFVAKNEVFQEFVADVAAQAATTNAADIEAFLAEPWTKDSSTTVDEALKALILAFSSKSKYFGTATAASIPSRTSTITISIRVKPASVADTTFRFLTIFSSRQLCVQPSELDLGPSLRCNDACCFNDTNIRFDVRLEAL